MEKMQYTIVESKNDKFQNSDGVVLYTKAFSAAIYKSLPLFYIHPQKTIPILGVNYRTKDRNAIRDGKNILVHKNFIFFDKINKKEFIMSYDCI